MEDLEKLNILYALEDSVYNLDFDEEQKQFVSEVLSDRIQQLNESINQKAAEQQAEQIFECWKHAGRIGALIIQHSEDSGLEDYCISIRHKLEYFGDHCEASGVFDMLVAAELLMQERNRHSS